MWSSVCLLSGFSFLLVCVCLHVAFTSAPAGVRAFRPRRPVRQYAADRTVDHTALQQLQLVDQTKLWETRTELSGRPANYFQ